MLGGARSGRPFSANRGIVRLARSPRPLGNLPSSGRKGARLPLLRAWLAVVWPVGQFFIGALRRVGVQASYARATQQVDLLTAAVDSSETAWDAAFRRRFGIVKYFLHFSRVIFA